MGLVRIVSAAALFLLLAVPSRAQDAYLGTVAAVESQRIQVTTIDPQSKQERSIWFAIDKSTRVKRGDRFVPLTASELKVGERVAVIIDPSPKAPLRAIELRLGETGTQGATAKPQPGAPADPHAGHKPAAPAADPHAGHQPAKPAQAGQSAPGQMPGMTGTWHLMQDGAIYGLFNRQGGPRGESEFVVPNWWMGMAMREFGKHQISLNGMLSLDAATVGKSGYAELFQVGEALDAKPLIDRQHPHDLFMQLAAAWRVEVDDQTSITFAGGPAGEPTLGPIAFMHRPSAAGLVFAPLGHHTFDSTHISFGVVSAAVERGPLTVEASLFNGREPDEDRWNFDFGKLDSFAGRVWFRPRQDVELQVSSGKLREPEELVEGDATRTTASGSWFREDGDRLTALSAGYGVNSAHGERRHGAFGEFTLGRGLNEFSGRLDVQQVETHVLLTSELPEEGHGAEQPPVTVSALTLGATRRLLTWRGFEGAAGAHATFYAVPGVLKETHGRRPVSFQIFFRLRLPTLGDSRMWNMRMSRIHEMKTDHSGHSMR